AVGERLEQAEGPDPVRAGSLLHPTDHPALEPDHQQDAEEQVDEDEQRLDQRQPEGGVAEVRGDRLLGRPGQHRVGAHAVPPFVTETIAPARPESERTSQLSEFVGNHTTWSAMAWILTGSVTRTSSAETVARSPSTMPRASAVSGERMARGAFAVPARKGSPSCSDPLSRRRRHVARTASPAPGSGTAARRIRGG